MWADHQLRKYCYIPWHFLYVHALFSSSFTSPPSSLRWTNHSYTPPPNLLGYATHTHTQEHMMWHGTKTYTSIINNSNVQKGGLTASIVLSSVNLFWISSRQQFWIERNSLWLVEEKNSSASISCNCVRILENGGRSECTRAQQAREGRSKVCVCGHWMAWLFHKKHKSWFTLDTGSESTGYV